MSQHIKGIHDKQVEFYIKNGSLSVKERIQQLKKLKSEINFRENEIIEALKLDFQKPMFESMVTVFPVAMAAIKGFMAN